MHPFKLSRHEQFASKSLKKKDWDFMFNLVIEAISDNQWEKMIEQHVPDDVVLRAAMKDPEVKKALAEYARKAAKKPKAQAVINGTDSEKTAKAS